jgi:predicted ArsR family transcriptional regulator
MANTRQRLLDQLNQQPALTARELANRLGVTIQNVRHHLKLLLDEGWVEVVGQRALQGRGRPSMLYALCGRHRPHNYPQLASALLHTALGGRNAEGRMRVIRKVAKWLGGDQRPEGGNLAQRLYHAVRWLNGLHYQARWEAHADGPRVIFGPCPYGEIIAGHRELCAMDVCLLSELLDLQVEQLANQADHPEGIRQCVFLIRQG